VVGVCVMVGIASIKEFFGDYPLYRQSGWDKLQTDDQFPYLGLTILFGILMFVFETYVDIRQLSNFYTIKTLPKEIKGVVSEDTFKKSSHYGGDKLFFGRFESVFSFIFALGLLLVGWFPYAWDLSLLSSDYTSNTLLKRELSPLQSEILTTIIFVVLTSIVDTLFSLPFSLYATFVIEQRHGFNKTVSDYLFTSIILLLDSRSLYSRQIDDYRLELCYWISYPRLYDLGHTSWGTILLFLCLDLFLCCQCCDDASVSLTHCPTLQ
jgi:hypothetical protein